MQNKLVVQEVVSEEKFVTFPDSPYQLCQIFELAGDQPTAIASVGRRC